MPEFLAREENILQSCFNAPPVIPPNRVGREAQVIEVKGSIVGRNFEDGFYPAYHWTA